MNEEEFKKWLENMRRQLGIRWDTQAIVAGANLPAPPPPKVELTIYNHERLGGDKLLDNVLAAGDFFEWNREMSEIDEA